MREKMQIKFCPRCRGIEIDMVGGEVIGLWKCKKCRYIGSVFPVKEIKLKNKKAK